MAPLARGLAALGVSPNMLTVAGAVTNLVAAFTLLYGHFVVGGVFVLMGGLCDLLDGALARVVGRQSRFGGVLDSTLDRYSDVLPILGLSLYYSGWHPPGEMRFGGMALCGVAILGSLLVPYVRARAERFVEKCDVGIAERAERVIIFAGGLIIGVEVWALWALAILTHLTVIQRLLYVRAQLRQESDASSSTPPEGEELTASDAKSKP